MGSWLNLFNFFPCLLRLFINIYVLLVFDRTLLNNRERIARITFLRFQSELEKFTLLISQFRHCNVGSCNYIHGFNVSVSLNFKTRFSDLYINQCKENLNVLALG